MLKTIKKSRMKKMKIDIPPSDAWMEWINHQLRVYEVRRQRWQNSERLGCLWWKTNGAIVAAAKVAQLNKTRKTEQIVCNLFRSMHVRSVFGVRIDVRDTFSGQNVRARAAPD